MAEDAASDNGSSEMRAGTGKDGRAFTEGNTRPDGSYIVGKGRTPSSTRFAAGDGRKRGRRTRGTRNLASDWTEELGEVIEITEGGKTRKISK